MQKRDYKVKEEVKMSKHKHDFVPVDVTWKDYWGKMRHDKIPTPGHVISACACGAVKLVKARLVEEKKDG